MDLMALLVNNIVKTQFSDLTPEAVEVAKKGILDTVGLILGGSSMRGCQLLVQAIKEMGGKEESTIAVFGGKVPPNLAALANCAMSRICLLAFKILYRTRHLRGVTHKFSANIVDN